jgi:ankyrin repeat protein
MFFLALGIITYLGFPFYVKSKAKHDLEKIGIVYSEQKFIDAACSGDDGSVALFIQAGMNINVLAVPSNNDRTTKSALHCAASTGNITLTKSLLDLGADVNIKDDNSNTPLFSASGPIRYNSKKNEVTNNLELVKLLISKGADINAGGVAGPPLMAAIQAHSFDVFDYLLEKGATVKVKNKDGMTPLMLMAYSYNNHSKDM